MAQQSLEDAGEKSQTESVSLRARGIELPDDKEARADLLDDLNEAVENVLDDHDLSANSVAGHAGHEYAQIAARCPECDGELSISEPRIGSENSAHALGECRDCEYIGSITYRIIDLEDEDEPTNSAVSAGKRSPNYVEYARDGR